MTPLAAAGNDAGSRPVCPPVADGLPPAPTPFAGPDGYVDDPTSRGRITRRLPPHLPRGQPRLRRPVALGHRLLGSARLEPQERSPQGQGLRLRCRSNRHPSDRDAEGDGLAARSLAASERRGARHRVRHLGRPYLVADAGPGGMASLRRRRRLRRQHSHRQPQRSPAREPTVTDQVGSVTSVAAGSTCRTCVRR